MKKNSGQSLIELLVAMGLFLLWVSGVALLFFNVHFSDRLAQERSQALFLATEAMEAVKSIRDHDWESLVSGEHGLVASGGQWVLQGSQEDVSDWLREGTRKVIIEDLDQDRKLITGRVSWEMTEERPQEVELITYLTNWAKVTGPASCDQYCQSLGYSSGVCRSGFFWCYLRGGSYEPGGDQYCTTGNQDTCCCFY